MAGTVRHEEKLNDSGNYWIRRICIVAGERGEGDNDEGEGRKTEIRMKAD